MRPAVPFAPFVALLLAGCTSDHAGHVASLDTGDIGPGASRTLTYLSAGTFAMHCHPHPWMEHHVTVVAGGPSTFAVDILDEMSNESAYRFEPANITVGIGAIVTYRNAGNFTHTATLEPGEHAM